MKSTVLISILTLAAAVASSASATQINQHAVGAFQPAAGSDAPYISYDTVKGVFNTHTSATKGVMGGMVYNPGANQIINIYGYNTASTVTTSCVVYVYDMWGSWVNGYFFEMTGVTGAWWKQFSFNNIPNYGEMAAYCKLPPNSSGRVFGYTVGA